MHSHRSTLSFPESLPEQYYGNINPAAAHMPDYGPFPIIEAALGILLFH